MKEIDLRPDCTNCAALCCVALAFDRSPMFAFDKAAGQACPHLDFYGGCSIHQERAERGFEGCINFDCLGAGQRATQHFSIDSASRKNRPLPKSLFDAFGNLLRAHEYLHLLDLADNLDLPHKERNALSQLRESLINAGFDRGLIAVTQSNIDIFLKNLRNHLD